MVREIVHDPIFLSLRSEAAERADLPVAQDLLDTLEANRDRCVGMAANMIGVRKCVIVFDNEGTPEAMLNPKILKAWEPFDTEEGCLSLPGTRKTGRFRRIKVEYQNLQMQKRIKTYTGWTAQIIQHEIDHCNGILI